MTKQATKEEVLATVAEAIRSVVAEDWIKTVPITMTTSFASELELESIEFVALAERLQQCYGKQVDFAGWIGGMDLKEIIGLNAGQVVEFIVRCQSQTPTE